jgi:hypothetical protein
MTCITIGDTLLMHDYCRAQQSLWLQPVQYWPPRSQGAQTARGGTLQRAESYPAVSAHEGGQCRVRALVTSARLTRTWLPCPGPTSTHSTCKPGRNRCKVSVTGPASMTTFVGFSGGWFREISQQDAITLRPGIGISLVSRSLHQYRYRLWQTAAVEMAISVARGSPKVA